MNRVIYTLLLYLILPLTLSRLLWRSRRSPEHRYRLGERLGIYRGLTPFMRKSRCVVFHAVSVGEVHAAAGLVKALLASHDEYNVVLTTTTLTGSARVRALFPSTVHHVYLPYDLPGANRRFLAFFRPDLLVLLETEIWPNLIHQCRMAGVRTVLANARLSEKSLCGYARFGKFIKETLNQLDLVCAQSDTDGSRMIRLGLKVDKLQVAGSLKFDIEPLEEQVQVGRALRRRLAGSRPVLVAASTRDGEEVRVLGGYLRMLQRVPSLFLILVPRHPERFDAVYKLCVALGLAVSRRSDCGDESQPHELQVLLGDSMGEMAVYYAASDIAFVGGSLVNTGCQNILEPAACGLPVITGPSRYNFQSTSDLLIQRGAQRIAEDEESLARVVLELLENPRLSQNMATAGLDVIRENRGSTAKTLLSIEALLSRP